YLRTKRLQLLIIHCDSPFGCGLKVVQKNCFFKVTHHYYAVFAASFPLRLPVFHRNHKKTREGEQHLTIGLSRISREQTLMIIGQKR
ncbi:hypothetical protein, partial [Pseudomonas sp. SIMBA_068]|uniref:hypothetical protein n=1 Tax=Pseudomonas sp. SIMBA_068 TaxID=3085808 RepID=UPI00397BEB0E